MSESLVREHPDTADDAIRQAAEPLPDKTGPRDEVLAELLTEKAVPLPEKTPLPAGPAPEPPADVDTSLIEGLLGEPDAPGSSEQKSG